jgi:hypothetical protein
MEHFLDIFRNKSGIVRAYYDCLYGSRRHLLRSFDHEVQALADSVAAEMENFRDTDAHLFKCAQQLLIKLMELNVLIPVQITDGNIRDKPMAITIDEKLCQAMKRTRAIILQNDRKCGIVKTY